MEKIDLYNAYFHGIRPPCDEKGFTKSNELMILESILKHGAIYSRRQMEELGIKTKMNNNLNRNGADNVSICEKDGFEYAISDAYLNWVQNHITIILAKDMPNCEFVDERELQAIDGEWQVKDQIPAKYFLGIGIPRGTSTYKQIAKEISWLSDSKEHFIKRLEDFFEKRHIGTVKRLLARYGYNLKLYDLDEGEEILSAKEYADELFREDESCL